MLLDIPKYLSSLDGKKSEPSLQDSVAATDVLLKEEKEKNVVRDKTECNFPDALKIVAETSVETPKYEIIIPNLYKLSDTIEILRNINPI